MTTQAPSLTRKPSLLEGAAPASRELGAVRTVLVGGLIVGVLDILDAITFFGLYVGATPLRIFQSVAAGLLGRTAARAGGLPTAALGAFLHLFIATTIVLVFYLASRRLPLLTRRPVLCGLAYGVVCYVVMTFVVLPLSAAGPPGQPRCNWPPLPSLLNGVIGHALLVGLPAALWVRHAAGGTARVFGHSAPR